MRMDAILPEVYTFIDFTTHGVFTARKKKEHEYSTHLGGNIPDEHPMPYNVYVPVREFLSKYPDQIEELIKYLETEFNKPSYEFEKVEITSSKCPVKRKFHRTKEYPQINVKLQW